MPSDPFPPRRRHSYRYVQFPTAHGVGYAVFSFNYTKRRDEGEYPAGDRQTVEYEFGVSFCSPKDRFEKTKGRLIADGRLEKVPVKVIGTAPVGTGAPSFVTNDDFYDLIPKLCSELDEMPAWAERAFKKDNFLFGLRQTPKPKVVKLDTLIKSQLSQQRKKTG